MLRESLYLVRERIEDSLARRQMIYPWWVPVTCFVGQVVCVVLALGMREALSPAHLLALTLPLVLVAPFVQIGLGRWLPWYLDSLGAVVAAGMLLASPAVPELRPMDAAPALLMFATATTTARDGIREGGAVGVVSAALIAIAAWQWQLTGAGLHALTVLLGFVVGAMLLWQMRALTAERDARERAWDRATTAERERIAREIHDLVAHSLSVSLLHVTGARHALHDVRDAGCESEVAEAVAEVDAALADAELVGRRAMTDIRRTVSAMADGASVRQPLPGATDIAGLVREMDVAGLHVEYDEQGDPGVLPAASGLGLYRIAQESLANVARHGDRGTARMRLHVTANGARLEVRNPLSAARPRGDGLGSGLAGMQARAAQMGATLDAGPEGSEWVVDARLGDQRPGDRRDGRIELPCGHRFALPGVAGLTAAPATRPRGARP
ncbi:MULTISPECIES: sensor histidine kinase [Nocardioides]|uniref:histidine kinase n=1 Tax=Nocardioides vastitatis TaxID=2568655 RepID=A0ABW0ZIP6_9ACTN|nr:histidine kinase [Nocardioides sp.]THI93727.1 histidine kinase [Nocardioides sp.]